MIAITFVDSWNIRALKLSSLPEQVERDYFLTTIWMSTTAQAQSYIIDIYPSQDNPNQTLWIFWHVGRQQAHYGSTIRGIGGTNYKVRNSWKYAGDDGALYFANKPTNEVFSLSPLFSSTNHPKDIDSITKRLHGSHGFGPFTTNTIYFQDRVTNVPTIFAGNASKTIGGIFMNDADGDEIGIRGTSGANLSYTNGQSFRWFGTGILDKPISDFDLTYPVQSWGSDTQNSPYFAANENSSVRIRIHSSVIPEPEEYALVFGLFALAFVFFAPSIQKKPSTMKTFSCSRGGELFRPERH